MHRPATLPPTLAAHRLQHLARAGVRLATALLVLAGVLTLVTAVLALPGCARLTRGDAATIETAGAVACAAMTLIPIVGGALAAACAGEEAALRTALDASTAEPDPLPLDKQPLVAVHAHGRHRGHVPRSLARSCAASLAAQ